MTQGIMDNPRINDPRTIYLIGVLDRLYPSTGWRLDRSFTLGAFRSESSVLDNVLMVDLVAYMVCVDHSANGWSWQYLDFTDDKMVCGVIKGLLDAVLNER
jgi:hypothetical protein